MFLTFVTRDIPYVNDAERVTVKDIDGGLYLVKAAYGFNEDAGREGSADESAAPTT